MSATDGLKALHDELLARKPEGAHHPEDCPVCAAEDKTQSTTSGGSMPETFTQEDIDAAVAAAVAPLQQRLGELEGQVQQSEVGKAVADAVAAEAAKLDELQRQLDAAEAARTVAESKLTETEQYWATAIAEHEAAAALAARRDERVARAMEVGALSEDYIERNADRFAAMTDDDFEGRIEEWRLIAKEAGSARPKASTSGAPAQTALMASAAPPASGDNSNLSVLMDLQKLRVDPRTLGGI